MLDNLRSPLPGRKTQRTPALTLERLEDRSLLAVTADLAAGVLTVTGDADRNNLNVALDNQNNDLVVRSFAQEIARFDSALVTTILVVGGAGQDVLTVDSDVTQLTTLIGQEDNDILVGGAGVTTLSGGAGPDKLRAGPGTTLFDGDGGRNLFLNVKPGDTIVPGGVNKIAPAVQGGAAAPVPSELLDTVEVKNLLLRAEGATSSNDAIIAIVDRNGRLLGVRVESGVDQAITGDPNMLVFAVDGALALARTGAFFGNNQAPLTSRTIQNISQSTITQREVEANPNIPDINSTLRGPGYVSPIGIKNHFPPDVPFTPQVDLFQIEHTNRDSLIHPGPDHVKGTGDDIILPNRFNIQNGQFAPGARLFAPESYGFYSGININAQARGIGTLPGGIPIYENGQLVGGIGVFFPGKTGFATESNSILSSTFDPTKPDRTLEAEYIGFAAVGGAPAVNLAAPTIAGIPPLDGFFFPITPDNQRIDLVGITLDIVGPGGIQGPAQIAKLGLSLGQGNSDGTFLDVTTTPGVKFQDGFNVSEGWIVTPRDGVGVTKEQVEATILGGIDQADKTRAAIRLPKSVPTKMVFAVADLQGNIVGLYRMPDATVFSIDVAVSKARNVAYYSSDRLQPLDQLPGIAIGTALTNRSFRYLALPRFPEGIDGRPPGPFSILNDGGTDPVTALQVGPRLPASAFQSVQGFDSFNPQTNFHDPAFTANQSGIVFFPGSEPLYAGGNLIGGFGVSGDGVDQDDVITVGGFTFSQLGAPDFLHIDQVFVKGVRVPYHKFNRNPEGGL